MGKGPSECHQMRAGGARCDSDFPRILTTSRLFSLVLIITRQ